MPGLGEPITRGDTCWYYYYGSPGRHDESTGQGAIGLATFTHGRIVGQQFEGEGWFSSIPFLCPGGTLTLDAVAREPITVAVYGTGYGGVQKGYIRQESKPVQGDSQEHAICWTSRSNLDEFRDQFIILRIYGKDSIVYGASFL